MSPFAAPHGCAQPGCPTLLPSGQGARCAVHRRSPWVQRESAARRGYGHAWRQLRARVLLRDRGVCVLCGAPATHVDHVVPKSQGGADDEANLRALCRGCHASKSGREGQAAPR